MLIESETATANDIIGLIERRELETWFQPVIDAYTSKVWGYECLLRAQIRGIIVSPGELIAVAESEQILTHLDLLARELHLVNASAILPSNSKILINSLPSTLLDYSQGRNEFTNLVTQLGMSPSQVTLEVIEHEPVKDPQELRRVVDSYREHGYKIALDDMGSAYAGLILLAELEPDTIKIDRELLLKAHSSILHREVCRSIVELGHRSGKPVILEGVETEWQYNFGKYIGVDLLQGYLTGRPVPCSKFDMRVSNF